jgi:hypothetical protein
MTATRWMRSLLSRIFNREEKRAARQQQRHFLSLRDDALDALEHRSHALDVRSLSLEARLSARTGGQSDARRN